MDFHIRTVVTTVFPCIVIRHTLFYAYLTYALTYRIFLICTNYFNNLTSTDFTVKSSIGRRSLPRENSFLVDHPTVSEVYFI